MFKALRQFFSPERHATVHKRLTLMSRRGPVYDFKEIMNTGGKIWPSSPALISTHESKLIPEDLKINGKSVRALAAHHPVSLLTVSYAAFSDSAVSSFSDGILPGINVIHLRPILNPLKWILWSKLIPPVPNSFVLRGDVLGADEVLEMHNKAAAYIFLIDRSGLIRWKASGPPVEAEIKSLNEAITLLIR